MKQITVTITTTEANQDIIAAFLQTAVTPLTIGDTDVDIELLFNADYTGDITVVDSELGMITSKAQAKRVFEWAGKIDTLSIETISTSLEATVKF